MKIEYRKIQGEDKVTILRTTGNKVVQIGVIMPDAAGNVGMKLAAFVIMNADQSAELARQHASLDREVRRKKANPVIKSPF